MPPTRRDVGFPALKKRAFADEEKRVSPGGLVRQPLLEPL